MIHTFYDHGDERLAQSLSPGQIRAALSDPAGVLWIDIAGAQADQAAALLGDQLDLDRQTVALAVRQPAWPRAADLGTHAFAILPLPLGAPEDSAGAAPSFLALWLGANALTTLHDDRSPSLAALRAEVIDAGRLAAGGAAHLAARVLAALAADVEASIAGAERELAAAEAALFDPRLPDTDERLHRVRRIAADVAVIAGAQADVLRRLADVDPPAACTESAVYFREACARCTWARQRAGTIRDRAEWATQARSSWLAAQRTRAARWSATSLFVLLPVIALAAAFAGSPWAAQRAAWLWLGLALAVLGVTLYTIARLRLTQRL